MYSNWMRVLLSSSCQLGLEVVLRHYSLSFYNTWNFINRSKYRIYISNVQQLNGNSIKFFLLTWTRSSSKTLQSKFLYTQNKRQLSSRVSSTQQLHYNQVLFQLWSMSWLDKIAKLLFIFLFFSFSFLFLFGLTTQEKSVRKCHRTMSYSQSHISRYHRVTSHDRVI